MGHMFLLICVSPYVSLYAKHHVWPETHKMLGTLLCLLSSYPCMCTTGRTSRDMWELTVVHCGPVIPKLPWYISGQSMSLHYFLHLWLQLQKSCYTVLPSSPATVSNNCQGHSLFLCHTPTSVSPLWQQSWFSHLILPWQNCCANGAESWGDGVGWEHPQRLKCHKPRFSYPKVHLFILNKCLSELLYALS